jgi:hypothetical protein
MRLVLRAHSESFDCTNPMNVTGNIPFDPGLSMVWSSLVPQFAKQAVETGTVIFIL